MISPRSQLSASVAEAPTLARLAFDRVRADILRCQLLPGERLRLDELRARYSISYSPLREALMRLASEGLVRLEDNRGFSVAAVSRVHLEDIARSRAEIEALTLGWSMERGGVEWEADLLGAFHRLSHIGKTDGSSDHEMSTEWAAEHRQFHLALISACGSPTMISLWRTLFDQFERYVALSIANAMRPRDDIREHRQIMNAAIDRNFEDARRLSRAHIERTKEKVLRSEALAISEGDVATDPGRVNRNGRRRG